jgi:lysophospholipase L1-like esterase
MQLVDSLESNGLKANFTKMIAGTGWTTGDLIGYIERERLARTFDIVTLLIGVNNQYRQFNKNTYRTEFAQLLTTAIKLAKGDESKVFVLSIPDWGVTPYAKTFGNGNTGTIALQIDQYNAINKEESEKRSVTYIDVTPISRQASSNLTLLASDDLHPSGKMYSLWVKLLSSKVCSQLK